MYARYVKRGGSFCEVTELQAAYLDSWCVVAVVIIMFFYFINYSIGVDDLASHHILEMREMFHGV